MLDKDAKQLAFTFQIFFINVNVHNMYIIRIRFTPRVPLLKIYYIIIPLIAGGRQLGFNNFSLSLTSVVRR